MSASIVFFLLFILPFIIAPFGVTQFENPKVLIAEGGIILLFLIAVFTNAIRLRSSSVAQLIVYSVIVLLTIFDLFFLRTNLSFFGNAFRLQGIFLLWVLLAFSILSKKFSFTNVSWLIYGILLLAQVVLLFFLPVNESMRRVGTFGEPNALAAFVIFLWPFLFFSIKDYKTPQKIGIALAGMLVCVVLFLSGSRSAVIALVIQLIYIILRQVKLSNGKVVIICLLFYGLSYIFPFFNQNPHENRIEVWRSAILAGSTKPLLGWGFGNTEIALHTSAKRLKLPIQYTYVDSSHNIFLDWWVEGGVLGLGIIIIIMYLAFKSFIASNSMRNSVLLLGLITCLSFNPASVVALLGFWWVIGQW